MPMYEYECSACHKRTEKIQKFSDAPLTVCPHCGAAALERTITAPAVHFAGGGWYKDGYGSAKPAPAAGPESDSKPASEPTPGAAPSTSAPSESTPSSTAPSPAAPAPAPATSSSPAPAVAPAKS